MTIQQPISGIARLTVVLTGSRRRKAAVMVGFMMIGAALFDPVGVDDASVALSPNVSGEDEFQQIELMLAELEREQAADSAPTDSATAATSQQPPRIVSNRSTTTSLVIPGSTDAPRQTTESETAVAVSVIPPPIVPTHGVSYNDSSSDSTSRAARPRPDRTESDNRARPTPRSIHLTGTIDPL